MSVLRPADVNDVVDRSVRIAGSHFRIRQFSFWKETYSYPAASRLPVRSIASA